jgi:Leucine-rich repeat (LRR) protein
MGNEDAGDNAVQPPPRNHDETKSSSPRVYDSLPAELGSSISQGILENPRSCNEQHPAMTQMTPDGPNMTDHCIAVARMPSTIVSIDEKSHMDERQETTLLDVQRQETELRPEVQDLHHISAPETILRRNTTSQYLAMLPPLRSGRRRQSLPGVERVGGSRPDLAQGNSNESGGNSIVANEQRPEPQPQALLWVHGHVVQEPDSALSGPLVEAIPIDDEDSLTAVTRAKNRRLRLMGAIACLVVALVAGLSIGIGTGKNSDVTNQSVSVVTNFVEMLPEFVSPQSQAALSNPLSAQSQARSWIESLPIHNTMTIERLKQRYGLAALFYSTGDQLWCKSDKWLTASDECTWFSSSDGPVCSDGVYTNLDLKENCLQNSIPDDIQLLSSLQTMNLSGNLFAIGTFPESLSKLASLTALSLSSSSITGTIPGHLKDLSNLELLDISFNLLTGNIEMVTALTALKVFDCSYNQLSGPIPTEIGQLSNLVVMTNSGNKAEPLPVSDWGTARGLEMFDRREEGVVINDIPSEIGNLSNLRRLEISYSPISGEIPSEIGRLMKLESLILQFNKLTGTIPEEVFAMTNLEHLDLSNNKLTGSLVSHVDHMDNLRFLSLEGNVLAGALPAKIGIWTSLRLLSVSSNHFSGTIPPELGSLEQLLYLDLSTNSFVGSIPSEIGKLGEISEIYLSFNSLSGTIPTEFGNLQNLTALFLDNTDLIAPIPSELGLLRKLYSMALFNTSIVGPMPAEICKESASAFLYSVTCDSISGCNCCFNITTAIPCDMNATLTGVPISG